MEETAVKHRENAIEWDEDERHASSEAGVDRVYEQTRRVREDLEGLVSAVMQTRSTWESSLRERLAERPYLGLATAAGVGYVLGAGVSPGMLRMAIGLGGRVAFAVMMRRLTTPLTEIVADAATRRTMPAEVG